MTKKPLTSLIVAVGVVSMALAGSASARSVSALTGSAQHGGLDVQCYNANFSNGTVAHSGCPTSEAAFLVPLTTDSSGSKAFAFTSRNAATTGGSCQAVGTDRFGLSMSISPVLQIPTSGTYVSQTTAPVFVPSFGMFFASCRTLPGDSLAEFAYSP